MCIRDSYYNAQIPDSMLEGDLENAQKQLSTQDSVDDAIQAEDIVKVQADELDGDRIKERGFANEFSVSFDDMTADAKAIFEGKKKGDLVQFDIFNLEEGKDDDFVRKYFLDINEDAEESPVVGNMFQAVITDVTRATPAELNQEFFDKYMGKDKVSSKEELMEVMRDRTKMYYDRQADSFLFRDIKEHLEAENKLTFPEAFLKRWMVASGNLPEGKTADEEIGNLVDGLGWTLIRGKLAKRFEVTVDEAEIKQRLRMQIVQMFGGQDLGDMMNDFVDKMYSDEQQYHGAYTQILSDKLFNSMKEVVTLNENDITTEELEKLVEEENAKHQPPAPEPEPVVEAPESGIEEAEVIEE